MDNSPFERSASILSSRSIDGIEAILIDKDALLVLQAFKYYVKKEIMLKLIAIVGTLNVLQTLIAPIHAKTLCW